MSNGYRLNDTLVRVLQDICDDSPVSRDIFDVDEEPRQWRSPTSCILHDVGIEVEECAVPTPSSSSSRGAVPAAGMRKWSPTADLPQPSSHTTLRDVFHLNLQQAAAAASQQQQQRATRLPPLPPLPIADALLHKACCNPKVSPNDIERLLRIDPTAASRSIVLKSLKRAYNPILRTVTKRVLQETYSFPLNLAIQYRASARVIEMLVDAAPHVLHCTDGSLQETPLAIFLKHHPHNVSTFDKMLLDAPHAASVKDRHHNTLAHIGARQGIAVEMMSHICILYPESLKERNFHGKTPIELAQQHTSSRNEAIASFLWEKQQLEIN